SPAIAACSSCEAVTRTSIVLESSQRERSAWVTPCWRNTYLHLHPPRRGKGLTTYSSTCEEIMWVALRHRSFHSRLPWAMSRLYQAAGRRGESAEYFLTTTQALMSRRCARRYRKRCSALS